jgi:hypothetical protein
MSADTSSAQAITLFAMESQRPTYPHDGSDLLNPSSSSTTWIQTLAAQHGTELGSTLPVGFDTSALVPQSTALVPQSTAARERSRVRGASGETSQKRSRRQPNIIPGTAGYDSDAHMAHLQANPHLVPGHVPGTTRRSQSRGPTMTLPSITDANRLALRNAGLAPSLSSFRAVAPIIT